jgi:prevent-host-death family protein
MLSSQVTSQEAIVRSWAVQDAKARFSEMLDACVQEGPQLVTKRGAEAAVLVPAAEWRRLKDRARPTLKELLLGKGPRFDLPVVGRGSVRSRKPPSF